MTEAHPDVQALVLRALEKAKRKRTSPNELYAMALEMRLKEVRLNLKQGSSIFSSVVFVNNCQHTWI